MKRYDEKEINYLISKPRGLFLARRRRSLRRAWVNLTLEGWQATGTPTQNVQQNTTSTLFHEIGERNTKNETFRGAVIDFENHARKVIGLPVRPYDLYHNKK